MSRQECLALSEPRTTLAYVALGANLGERAANIRRALKLLRATRGVRVTRTSPLRQYAAVGGPPDSPPFLNAVARLRVELSAGGLLSRLLAIEAQIGRVRKRKWEPRLIDLDLLLYGRRVIRQRQLIVPHPRMHLRAFVLEPLAAIAPKLVHPVLRQTIGQLLKRLRAIAPPRSRPGPRSSTSS
jgi:2-amino-4-hydroxy-6-hydroxymethyldihydropteridine diphosphokinase